MPENVRAPIGEIKSSQDEELVGGAIVSASTQEIPNPNEFYLDEIESTFDQDALRTMEQACPVIPASWEIVTSILGYPRTINGEGKQTEFAREAFSAINNFGNVLTRGLEAIKGGFQPFEIVWGTDGSNVIFDKIKDYSPSLIELRADGGIYLDTGKGQMEKMNRQKFKIFSYRVRFGNEYGYGKANNYFVPYYFYTQGSRFWSIFVERLGDPKVLYMGTEENSLNDVTVEKLQEFHQDQRIGSGMVCPQKFEAFVLEASQHAKNSHQAYLDYWGAFIAHILVGTAEHLFDKGVGSEARARERTKLRDDVEASYIRWLEMSVHENFMKPLMQFNYPDLKEKDYPKWKISPPRRLKKEEAEVLKILFDMGVTFSHTEVRERAGYQEPESEEDTLKKTDAPQQIGFSNTDRLYALDLENLVEK